MQEEDDQGQPPGAHPLRPTQQGLGPPFSDPTSSASAPAGERFAWATGESTLPSAQLTPWRTLWGEKKKFGNSFPVSSTFETQLKSKE